MLNSYRIQVRTTRTSLAHFVSFQHLMFVRTNNKEIPKQVRNDNRAFAFTLAEVLITLVIIGVIAALTIPNLMQSWRKHERITQIKTAYSIIQNATKMAIAEHGNPSGWDFNSCGEYTTKYFLPYVKIQKKCNEITSDCFIKNDNSITWYLLNGDIQDINDAGYGAYYYSIFILQNGMQIGIWAPAKKNQGSYRTIYFLVDVNGKQGPTTLGKDIFTFNLNLDTTKFTTGGYPRRYDTSDCTLTNRGYSCAYWIEKNHWNFPDNYPVKKF